MAKRKNTLLLSAGFPRAAQWKDLRASIEREREWEEEDGPRRRFARPLARATTDKDRGKRIRRAVRFSTESIIRRDDGDDAMESKGVVYGRRD